MDAPNAAIGAHSPAPRNHRYPTIPDLTATIVDDIVNLDGGDDDSDSDEMPALEDDPAQTGWLAAQRDRRLFWLECSALIYSAGAA
jgi:hypothetical protein